ncbi:MAG: glycosyltransferase family 2 protein [Methanobrevibacter sp.]|nr:glycosyltransferase family 2 protein [Methanobrevibacter sp.]
MTKVSVVMPVYNAGRFLDESVNSILNQTLDDLELICVDDGSTDDSLSILNDFASKDDRVKVFSLDHQGGGNARNYGLTQITGDYLFCMDADDTLDLNAFEDFCKIAEEKNLDFLVFKAINYGVEKDHFFETEYQNMTSISNLVEDNVFSYKDIGNLLFDFNVSPWCKFYNSEFIKNSGAQFRENSKFHDNQFFWDIIFQAERILFIDKFYYTRKRYNDSLTASGDKGHINIIGVVNDIIQLFIKHGELDNYKNKLYNLKITWIIDRYNQIQEQFKEEFFKELKKDFESLKNTEFEELLTENHKFIFNNAVISNNHEEFDLMNDFYSNALETLGSELKECISIINKNKIEIDRLNSENDYFKNQNKKLTILNIELLDELERKNKFRNVFSKSKILDKINE